MRPLPRQKIYKIYFLDFIFDLLTFNLKKINKVKKLENKILSLSESKYGLALNRGRLGAFLAVKSIVTTKKNKIILSPFTIFDVINMVICAGGIPVFADVDKYTITINLENIKKCYTPDVAGILITHNHQINKDIDEIIKFKNEKNIFLIEDCAISFGTKYNNKFIGTLGDISFYSFGIFKFVSSLNGGFILTNNENCFNIFKNITNTFANPSIITLFKNFFKAAFITLFTQRSFFKYFVSYIIRLGYLHNIKFINKFAKNDPKVKKIEFLPNNYKIKISNHQALTIIKQLENYSINQDIRKKNAEIYYNELKDVKEISIPKYFNNTSDGWINFPIQYENRDDLLNFLFKNNRDLAKYFYRNCNDLEIFTNYQRNLPIIKSIVNNLIILPTYPNYDIKQVQKNISLIKKYFEYQ